jgi:Caspase domain
MRAILSLLLAFCSVISAAPSIAQEPARLALLIGNQGYTAKVGPLRNPRNDVNLIEASLKQIGFKVTVLKDASYKTMDSGLKRYVTEVRRAGRGVLSFFYYSGHGVANPETQINYLIPIDVTDADDDKVWFESFQQNTIIDLLSKQAPNATHYVVFDACRNELNITGSAAKALGTDKGFVPIADTSGLLIAYATAPKKTASDVGVGGSPYAKVLAEELVKPGIESVSMFRNVQIRVKQTIGQDPWLSFPSLPAVYFAGAKPPETVELTFWSSVKDSVDPAVLNTYLERYPNGEFAPIARALIEHYERQLKLELAAREGERKRQEEEMKAAEAKRLEEEQRDREVAFAEERKRAEEAKNTQETQRLEREMLVRNEELRKALEDVRAAREGAKIAEEQRLAAVKAAETAAKAAEQTIAAKRDAEKTGDPAKVAALPKLEQPSVGSPFDGIWYLHRLGPGCSPGTQNVRQVIVIANGAVKGQGPLGPITGTVSSTGHLRYGHTSHTGDRQTADGYRITYQAALRGNSGSGTFEHTRPGSRCHGTITAKRG